MAYTIAVPIQGQNISPSLFGAAVRNAINDLDSRVSAVEAIAIARINKLAITADSATFTTAEFEFGTIAGSLVTGWTYQVNVHAACTSTTATDMGALRIRQDTSAGTQMQTIHWVLNNPQNAIAVGTPYWVVADYTAVATGSKTFSCTMQREGTSAGTFQMRAGGSRPTYLFLNLVFIP
jgi:hypothetical protein